MSNTRLKPWVYVFLETYINDPINNQTRAMLKAKPHLTYNSANTSAIRLLQNPTVKQELEKLREESMARGISSRSAIQVRLDRLARKAEEADDLSTSVKAVTEIAKLAHLYNNEESETAKFSKFIQGLTKAKEVKSMKSAGLLEAQKDTQ